MKNFRKVTILLIVLAVVIIIGGASYAYYQIYIKGEDTGITGYSGGVFPQGFGGESMMKSFFMSGVEVALETMDNGYINAKNINLIKDYEVSAKAEKGLFIVINRDYDNQVKYSISLTELNISENLQDKDFKWELVSFGTDNVVASGDFEEAFEENMVLVSDLILNSRTAHEYELRLWLEETGEIQNHLLNGSFEGKISISADVVNSHMIK